MSVFAKKKTNEEFVLEAMNYSPYGALVQVFIISCMSAYTQQTIDLEGRNNPMPGFCDNEVWLGIAKDLQKKMDAQYGREPEAPNSKLTDKPN